ncbi:MAG: ABC transporter ATP-binding protein [Synergistetes bacterium]|nr:MAG: Iron (III) ABC transporter, ATP-binding protein (HemV-1) [bacterium 42_11]MBC7330821.1 ABC transporter ATP-binding protein [Synergistota bacterium]
MLEVRELSYLYGKREVLRDIAFSVGEGESLFILGPNGSGKTTLLKCLNGILKPKGTVYVNKLSLRELALKDIARIFGYVPQRGEASFLTVFDAVLLGRRPYLRWRASEEDVRVAEEAIKLLKIEGLAFRRLNELSGGELQLVLIARAFAQEPKYLLLDEPTNNLDVKNQIEVMRLIKDAVRKRGITAIITVHDINLALAYADRVLVLKEGKVYAFGGKEVINERLLSEVYGISAKIHKFDGRAVFLPQL